MVAINTSQQCKLHLSSCGSGNPYIQGRQVDLSQVPPKSKTSQKTRGGKKKNTKVPYSQAKDQQGSPKLSRDNTDQVPPNNPGTNFQSQDMRYDEQGNRRGVPKDLR